MTAVIYARYSSDNQREESIEGQGSLCTADKAANGTLGAADFLGKLRLADVVLFHQVRKTDVGWCGQIFLCHVVGPPFGVFSHYNTLCRFVQYTVTSPPLLLQSCNQ